MPIDADTTARLQAHIARQERERCKSRRWTDTGLVFTRLDPTPVRPQYATRHFQRLAREAGVPVIRLHDLRHTNASLALAAGVGLKVVSERLGHSQLAITADLYTHVGHDLARAAADQIASALDGASVAFPTPVLPPTAVPGAGEH